MSSGPDRKKTPCCEAALPWTLGPSLTTKFGFARRTCCLSSGCMSQGRQGFEGGLLACWLPLVQAFERHHGKASVPSRDQPRCHFSKLGHYAKECRIPDPLVPPATKGKIGQNRLEATLDGIGPPMDSSPFQLFHTRKHRPWDPWNLPEVKQKLVFTFPTQQSLASE